MTLTNSDVTKGTITQSEMGYTKAEFSLKKGTSVSDDERIVITEDYTSLTATSPETIFDGIIEEYTLTDIKNITSVSKQDEVARLQPLGYYQGLTTVALSKMIDVYGDYIAATYTPIIWTDYYDAPYNFSAQAGRKHVEIDFVDTLYSSPPTVQIYGDLGGHNKILIVSDNGTGGVIHNFSASRSAGTIEFWWRTTNAAGHINFEILSDDDELIASVYFSLDRFRYNNGTVATTYCEAGTDNEPVDNRWYRVSMTLNGNNTYDLSIYEADGETNCKNTISAAGVYTENVDAVKVRVYGVAGFTFYFDAYGESWDENYTVGDNVNDISYTLPVSTNLTSKGLSGGQPLQSLLTEGAIIEKYIWALAPDGDIRWHDGEDSSGVVLDGTQIVWDVSAKAQVKRINRVILKGAGGLEAMKEDTVRQASAGQIIIYKDYRADIDNQTDLDTMAQSLLDVQKNPPLTVQLSMQWEAKGWIQVGETIEIQASKIKYNNSSSYIPAGHYRIVSETYHIVNGVYNYIELTLEDGLHYVEQLDSDKIAHNTQNANTAYGGTVISGGSSSGGLNNVVEDVTPQLGGDLDLNGKNIDFPSTPNISDCLNQNNMLSDSPTKLATQSSIKAYADSKVTAAQAVTAVSTADDYLKNDANDETTGDLTVANLITAGNVDGVDVSGLPASIAAKLPLAGGEMSGNITMAGAQTVDGKDVSTLGTDAEAHAYVEANALTMTQDITFNAGQTFDGKDVSTLGTDAEAVAAVATADDYLKNDANDETTGDLTVANLITTGNVDGHDVSAMATDLANQCTTAEAITAVSGAMGGDVTGTVGASVVGNDSHTHDTQYYTEAEIDAHKHDTATLENDAIASDAAGGFNLSAANVINFKPSNDNDDYIAMFTTAGVPLLTFVGGDGQIKNVVDPTLDQDVSTKKYHDDNKTVAGDLNHDDIANPQGNAEEQHLTSAQVGALHAEAHSIASHNDTTATGAELETLTDGSETALHIHDGRYYTEDEIDAMDIHPETHDHDAEILQNDGINSNLAGAFDFKTAQALNFKISADLDDYIQFITIAGVPYIAFMGGTGKITQLADPTAAQDAATKAYADTKTTNAAAHAHVEATALTLENDLAMGTHKITGVVDPTADQEAATKKYVDDNAGAAPGYVRISLERVPITGAFSGDYVQLNAVNEDCATSFYVDTYVDASADMVFTWTHRCTSADATVICQWYVAANKTDGTEDFAWNIESATAFNADSTTANKLYKTTYTLANANFETGDVIHIRFRLNNANRDIRIHNISLLYKHKTS